MTAIIEAKNQHVDDLIRLNDQVQKIHAEQYPDIFKYPVEEASLSKLFASKIADPNPWNCEENCCKL